MRPPTVLTIKRTSPDHKVELKGNSKKGELGVGYRDADFIVSRYYESLSKSSFAVFDWNGEYIRDLDLSMFLSEGEKEPQGKAAGGGKFVFHVRNREEGKDKFIGVDLASSEEPWLYEMDMGHTVGMDKVIHAGRYIVSPIGKGGVKKDFLANGRPSLTEDSVTRVLDRLHVGQF